MWSTEKKPASKKALSGAVYLIESFALFQNDDLAKQLRKHTSQLNDIIASSSRDKQSTINTFFKPMLLYLYMVRFSKRKVQHLYLLFLTWSTLFIWIPRFFENLVF